MKCFVPVLIILFTALTAISASADEHIVERGETALQIALDHNLTMDQLSQLNPGIDLEMMAVGEKLIVPEKGISFDKFRSSHYSRMVRINDLNCSVLADSSALCLFHAENLTELPLFDLRIHLSVLGQNGNRGQAEGSTALMQILPGEKLPMAMSVPGSFDAVESAEEAVLNLSQSELLTASFRIPDGHYRQSVSILPDGISATVTIEFNADIIPVYQGKSVNVLAAAYDNNGQLTGVRSLYSDFYPRLDVTTYAVRGKITDVKLFAEVY